MKSIINVWFLTENHIFVPTCHPERGDGQEGLMDAFRARPSFGC